VVALLDDGAGLHHQDDVRVADRGEPVRDDETRPTGTQQVHRPLDQHLGTGVDRAGRLVEDQDARLGEERSGDGDELLLPGADVRPLVVQDGVEAVRQASDEAVDVCRLRCRGDRLGGGLVGAVRDVLRDGAAEQPGVLQHHAHVLAQFLARHAGDVHTVQGDPPAGHVVEPHQQIDQGGLARPGRPDDGHGLSGQDGQRQVVDQRLVRQVAEGHVLERDPPGDPRRQHRPGGVGALLGGVEELEDPLGRGDAGLHEVRHARHLGEWLTELP
jgi:hypothetical protein